MERRRSLAGAGRWTTLVLHGGLSVNEAVARAFAEARLDGGFLRLNGARISPLRYVIPAASDGLHAAWYSETFTPEGSIMIEEAGVIAGRRDGERFLHCHGIWRLADGSRRAGHLLPHDSIIDRNVSVEAFGVVGATFDAQEDAETAFKLFAPCVTSGRGGEGNRAILCAVRPNQDINLAIEALCREHGVGQAKVHGIGSLIGADFEEGTHVASYATEVLIRRGWVEPTADGPRCRLDIALVDMDGAISEGFLVRGQNPICVTFELLIEEERNG